MKTLIGIAVLMMASAGAWGQVLTPSTEPGCARYAPGEKHLPNVPACAPLNCGKYQHVVHMPGCWGSTDGLQLICDDRGPHDECANDIHEVTEKEWQELLTRLKALEKKLQEPAK